MTLKSVLDSSDESRSLTFVAKREDDSAQTVSFLREPPGSKRFAKDMLLRRSRQVLTAGKADEVVSDAGGPRPNHSVFTGHLLEGLGGKAKGPEGLTTGNGVMAYVYQMVSSDADSHQTPHYGFLRGDGDFIFSIDLLPQLETEDGEDKDILISVPAIIPPQPESVAYGDTVTTAKQYLSEGRLRIQLHDLVASEVRKAYALTSADHFPPSGGFTPAKFAERLTDYEKSVAQLCGIGALIAYWGGDEHLDVLTLPLRRLTDRLRVMSGTRIWVAAQWYPIMLLYYAFGIAAVAGDSFKNLAGIFGCQVSDPESADRLLPLSVAVFRGIADAGRAFKTLPGQERNLKPRSEYLFKHFQPLFSDLFYLGAEYEKCFDEFEVLAALDHADRYGKEPSGQLWGPIGRFGYKARRRRSSPYHRLTSEASNAGAKWGAFEAGLFEGSVDRFEEVRASFDEWLKNERWS